MATQYEPIVKDSTLNTTESTPRNIADVLADELVISDLVTQAQAIVTKLQGIISAVKPNASDIPLDPITGMSANNVQLGISELKGTLDELLTKESRTGTTNANGGISLGLYLAHPVLVVIPKTTNANVYAFVVATLGGMQWAMFKNADGSTYASQSIDFDIVYC